MTKLKICSLRSSSKGNSLIVYNESTAILVDCGISGKTMECCLGEIGISPESLDAIVVTHEHTDHTKGVGVVARKFNIPVYATYGTWGAMLRAVGEIPQGNRKVCNEDMSFVIGDVCVTPFSISHDAMQPVGFVFEYQDEKIGIATDTGIMTEEIFENISGCQTVLLESNYDLFMLEAGQYPYDLKCRIKSDVGHLCNDDAALVARDLAANGTKTLIMGHISPENNYPELVYQTVKLCLESNGFKVGSDIQLYVAKRDMVLKTN